MMMKEKAKQVIDALPDNTNMDEIIHALYVVAKFNRGEREIREGKGIPHQQVKKNLRRW